MRSRVSSRVSEICNVVIPCGCQLACRDFAGAKSINHLTARGNKTRAAMKLKHSTNTVPTSPSQVATHGFEETDHDSQVFQCRFIAARDAAVGCGPGPVQPATTSRSWAPRRSIPSPPRWPSSSARPASSRPRRSKAPAPAAASSCSAPAWACSIPDATNASRAIKQSEIDACTKAGVKDIIEVKVGYDGIVLAELEARARRSS